MRLAFFIPHELPLNGTTMKKTGFLPIAGVILAFATSSSAFAFGVGLTPSTVELDVQPGSHNRQILRVRISTPISQSG